MDLFLNSSLMKLPFIFYQHIIHHKKKNKDRVLIFFSLIKITAQNTEPGRKYMFYGILTLPKPQILRTC